MTSEIARRTFLGTLAVAPTLMASNYSAEKISVEGVEAIRLTDSFHKTQVTLLPSFGNNAYEMAVNGKNLFWTPAGGPAQWKARPAHLGNPFLAPWANRLDHEGFYANGKHYGLNQELRNYGTDQHRQPIHGLLVYSDRWRVTEVRADAGSAMTTSELEFGRYPDLMAQYPFAHTLRMQHILRDGVLEVATEVENHSAEAMPVSLGYHPYFRLHGAPRAEWKVTLPVTRQVLLSDKLVPTGEDKGVEFSGPVSLASRQFDDVFTGLQRAESGRAEFAVEAGRERISVLYGPKYTVAVVYAPPGRDFICFEPMTGPTNAFNLAHAGLYRDLQTIPAGGKWRESFWIRGEGF